MRAERDPSEAAGSTEIRWEHACLGVAAGCATLQSMMSISRAGAEHAGCVALHVNNANEPIAHLGGKPESVVKGVSCG